MNAPSRVLVIGAGGRTGRLVCERAARDGQVVTTLSRSPIPAVLASQVHRQVIGDARDAEHVREALRDQDAVITTVAAPGRAPSTVVSDVTRTVLAEMSRADVNRIVITSSRNLTATKPWVAVAPTKWYFRHIYADLARAEELIRASNMAWTIVRAVMLTDTPPSGRTHIDEAQNSTGGDWKLPRGDYAQVLLEAAMDPETIGKALGVNGLS